MPARSSAARKKQPAAKVRAKPRAKARAKAKSAPKPKARAKAKIAMTGDLAGFEILAPGPKPKVKAEFERRVERTPPLHSIKKKFGLKPDAAPAAKGGSGAGAAHGKIVRVRRVAGSLDPADEIGEKAVYLNPQGRVEFRQG